MAESFFATLKTELYYRRVWPAKKRARIEVGRWIEDRYNRRRRSPRSVRSAPWISNCNTHARSRTLKKPHNPCPRNGGRANKQTEGEKGSDHAARFAGAADRTEVRADAADEGDRKSVV